jgi:hypothetical protein
MQECLGCALRDQVLVIRDYIDDLITSEEIDPWVVANLLEQEVALIDRVFVFEGLVGLVGDFEE